MSTQASPSRVLCVDDEPQVLDGLRRTLHGRYELVLSTSADEALDRVTSEPGAFDVVMSDLSMPGTDGISLLSQIREVAPASVRVLLTGHADLDSAMKAVNEGHVFRFLCKPASREQLIAALDAASEQHRLILAEKQLLEETLRGSVAALLETLSLANAPAFARTHRILRRVTAMAERRGVNNWELEVATMLSQIGAVTLPPEVVAKLDKAQPLSPEERDVFNRVPLLTEKLLGPIPRLEEVRRIIRYQGKNFDGQGLPADDIAGENLPVGSRMLKLALDIDLIEAGMGADKAIDVLRRRSHRYDPALLEELEQVIRAEQESAPVMRDLDPADLQLGMIIEQDVCDKFGKLVVGRGREITDNVLDIIQSYAARERITGRVTVSG